MTPEQKKHIRNKAKKVREATGLASVQAIDISHLLKRVQEKYSNFSWQACLEADMGTDEAWMDTEREILFYKEGALRDAMAGKPRARFTFAHELGHYVLGHTGNPRRNADKGIYETPKEKAFEREADLFASYLLAPSELAHTASSPQEVECRFQISSQAAEIAFERAKRDIRADKGEKRKSPQGVIDFLSEARRRGYKPISEID